jgi:uncharacterized RDD family membrane protein YckC
MESKQEGVVKPGLWGRRFVALFIDVLFLTLFLWALTAVIYPLIAGTGLFYVFNYWVLLAGIIILLYFTYFEGKNRASLGKNVMKLEVRTQKGDMDYRKAFIRNLSKFLWFPLIIDVLIGFALGGSRQRYLDRAAGTEVIAS